MIIKKPHSGNFLTSFPGAVLVSALTLIFVLGFYAAPAYSVEASMEKKLPPDVRVVIDVSGSMKQNDPDNLRRPALDLLVQLLPKDAKAGVWTFGQWVNMLVPHKPVNESWRKEAGKLAKQINSVGLYTNIGEALEKAAYDFDKLESDDFKRKYRSSVILLTDGVVDISKSPQENSQERARILEKILPVYQRAGVTIHTVALSHNADKQLLEQLAIDTGGIAAVAESADELMKIFLRAFDDAAPAEQVPLAGNKFLIDSSIEEFTALVFRKANGEPTALISPDKTRYDLSKQDADLRWHQSDDYDLITMQRPVEGEWEIIAAADPDNRVTVVSDLSLDVSRLPRNLFLGSLPNFDAMLSENGKVIDRQEFLNLMDVSVEVRSVGGTKRWRKSLSKDSVPSDGIYSASLSMLKKVGDYEAYIHVDGKTFKRSNKQLIAVREAFELVVEEQQGEDHAQVISLYARNSNIDMDSASSLARIKIPSGRTLIKPLVKSAQRQWQLAFTDLVEKGEYKLNIEVEGKYLDGSSFSSKQQPVSFYNEFGSEPVPVVKKNEEKEKPEQIKSESKPDKVVEQKEPSSTKPEEESVEAPVLEEGAEEESVSSIVLYGGLVLGNLLIIALGYLAYRMVTGGGKSKVLDEDEEDNADIDAGEAEETGEDEDEDDGGEESISSSDVAIDPMAEMEELMASPEKESAEPASEGGDDMGFMDDIIEIAPDEDDK